MVRVTIGRIEVHAAPPSPRLPAAEPARPRRPPLTLEAYLKQREGER